MYSFVDPVTGSKDHVPTPLRTVFNGKNLDEKLTDETGLFRTLTVSGRGVLARRINTNEAPYKHGLIERGYTYQERVIEVKFLITDQTSEGLRDRFNRLNALLLGRKKRLKFTDEDAYFYATLQQGEIPEEDQNQLIGTLTFLCSDPAKYKESHTITVSNEWQTYNIEGQATTLWTTRTVFSGTVSHYMLESNLGKIVLNYEFGKNDVLVIDYEKRKITLNGVTRMPFLSFDSVWFKLQAGEMELQASEPTELTYTERYY
ncbi:distal tail protein Dit [Bacillus sp. FSL W7-1360]